MKTRLPPGEWLKDEDPVWAFVNDHGKDDFCQAANHYLCTLRAGHRGRHVATGAQMDEQGRRNVFEVWR